VKRRHRLATAHRVVKFGHSSSRHKIDHTGPVTKSAKRRTCFRLGGMRRFSQHTPLVVLFQHASYALVLMVLNFDLKKILPHTEITEFRWLGLPFQPKDRNFSQISSKSSNLENILFFIWTSFVYYWNIWIFIPKCGYFGVYQSHWNLANFNEISCRHGELYCCTQLQIAQINKCT
jgi:hypothetical protein